MPEIGWARCSLKHADREAAKEWAKKQANKLTEGTVALALGRITWATLFTLYSQLKTPKKSASEQVADARRVELWTRLLGGGSNPLDISPDQWETFIGARRSGAMDAYGNIHVVISFGKFTKYRIVFKTD